MKNYSISLVIAIFSLLLSIIRDGVVLLSDFQAACRKYLEGTGCFFEYRISCKIMSDALTAERKKEILVSLLVI